MKYVKSGAAVAFALLALACAGVAKPTHELASAEASLRAAQELNAKRHPKAELHMRLAEEQLVRAHKLMDDGDNERAASVLSRARADAELAIALSKEADARDEHDATLSSGSASTYTTPMKESAHASR
jgi:hypothetical protein